MAERSDDPVQDLRRGLDYHVAFGLADSAAYLLMFGDSSNFAYTPGKREGEAILLALVARAAQAGRLAVAVPEAAAYGLGRVPGRGAVTHRHSAI